MVVFTAVTVLACVVGASHALILPPPNPISRPLRVCTTPVAGFLQFPQGVTTTTEFTGTATQPQILSGQELNQVVGYDVDLLERAVGRLLGHFL